MYFGPTQLRSLSSSQQSISHVHSYGPAPVTSLLISMINSKACPHNLPTSRSQCPHCGSSWPIKDRRLATKLVPLDIQKIWVISLPPLSKYGYQLCPRHVLGKTMEILKLEFEDTSPHRLTGFLYQHPSQSPNCRGSVPGISLYYNTQTSPFERPWRRLWLTTRNAPVCR